MSTQGRFADLQKTYAEAHSDAKRMVDETVTAATGHAHRVGQDYVGPGMEAFRDLTMDHPISAVFLLSLAALSAIPIGIFLTFATVTLFSFVLGSLIVAICAALTVISFGGFLLLCTLCFTLGAAIFATSSYIAARLTYRLVFHLFNEKGQGPSFWLLETLNFFGLGEMLNAPQVEDEKATSRGEFAHGMESSGDTFVHDPDVKKEDGSADEWSSVDKHSTRADVVQSNDADHSFVR